MPDLHKLHIMVVHPHDADGDALARQLRRIVGRVAHIWPVPERLAEPVDLLFFRIDRTAQPLAALLVDSAHTAVVGVLSSGGAPELLSDLSPHAVVARPFEGEAVQAAIVVARANFNYQRRLSIKVAKLEETLRSMRKVERAKTILMEKRRIDEPAAYAFLRDQAMKRRMPIGAVASAVIDSAEVMPND